MELLFNEKQKPLEEMSLPWLYTEAISSKYPEPSINSGKFLLFVDEEEIDSVWETIRIFILGGELTRYAKVSTALKRKYSNKDSHVICIYTYDHTDKKDLKRVENKLVYLGFERDKIKYKTDEDTRNGKYYSGYKI